MLTGSRSLAGVVDALTYEYAVPVAATNGQRGAFLRATPAPVAQGRRELYLGDWDWQGAQIEANTRRVLAEYGAGPWERLTLTEEQVRDRDLTVTRKLDRRYRAPRWHEAVETEALGQQEVIGIVRARLDELLPEPLDAVLAPASAGSGIGWVRCCASRRTASVGE